MPYYAIFLPKPIPEKAAKHGFISIIGLLVTTMATAGVAFTPELSLRRNLDSVRAAAAVQGVAGLARPPVVQATLSDASKETQNAHCFCHPTTKRKGERT